MSFITTLFHENWHQKIVRILNGKYYTFKIGVSAEVWNEVGSDNLLHVCVEAWQFRESITGVLARINWQLQNSLWQITTIWPTVTYSNQQPIFNGNINACFFTIENNE